MAVLRRWWPALLLVGAAVWICLPMWRFHWWYSHEDIWYPVRVSETLASWHGGGWYARWCPDLWGGYGYPFLNYYAPGVYVAGAAVTSLGMLPASALKLVMLAVSCGGAVAAFGAVRGETRRVDAALVGGALFVFLPYRATDLFTRGDLAEYTAFCLAPAALWAFRAIGRATARGDRERAGWAAIAAAFALAGILMTHTITGMFATEIAGAYALYLVWRDRRQAWLAWGAIGAAIALALVYVGPALVEKSLVHLDRISGAQFATVKNMVTLAQFAHDPFFALGAPFLVGALLWLAALAIPRTRAAARRSAGWWLVALGLIVLILPWGRIAWRILPFGGQVQFPWRLLGFVGLFGALGLGTLWAGVAPETRASLVAAVILLAPLPLVVHTQRAVTRARPVPTTPDGIRREYATTTAMDEYLPRTVPDRPPLRIAGAWSTAPGVVARVTEPDGLHRDIAIDTPAATTVTVGTFAFPGWKRSASRGARIIAGKDGLYHVVTDGPGHFEAHLAFEATRFHHAVALISLLALLLAPLALRRAARRFA